MTGLLAACTEMPEPSGEPKTVAGRVPFVGGAIDARTAARNFIEVVEAVEPVAEAECRRRAAHSNCDLRIVVDDRPGMPPNAFQTIDSEGQPIIAFTLSLIAEARNKDEIAFVMAHEAAHHIEGHLDRQREYATAGAVVFGQLAGVLGAGSEDEIRTAQEIGAVVGARSYSKSFELEADDLGTIITARAGFNPIVGADFFFRIPDPDGRFLSTHPPNAERYDAVITRAATLGITPPMN
ncbi:peptidase M48 [Pelagovum pacificum]|uniref:Peptidase M48 n=2 Tax=Pelagovum pacificum TaxID=2588711 RepID=A0A5C5GHV0_9RHOB|nr:M48 family metallopeptidase [Pelagovum pacificum]TNY34368.1 peptidase M48 [Pelagovum pacificum]